MEVKTRQCGPEPQCRADFEVILGLFVGNCAPTTAQCSQFGSSELRTGRVSKSRCSKVSWKFPKLAIVLHLQYRVYVWVHMVNPPLPRVFCSVNHLRSRIGSGVCAACYARWSTQHLLCYLGTPSSSA